MHRMCLAEYLALIWQLLRLLQPSSQTPSAFLLFCLGTHGVSPQNGLSHQYCQEKKSNHPSRISSNAPSPTQPSLISPPQTNEHLAPLSINWHCSDFLMSCSTFYLSRHFSLSRYLRAGATVLYYLFPPTELWTSPTVTLITPYCDWISVSPTENWVVSPVLSKWQAPSGHWLKERMSEWKVLSILFLSPTVPNT